ncbi:unnamed protein product [Bemisia tabaci]|uniref:CABIT domain-containing protein n=1 Tax=Bemisia tabaci TaxID=7038 RepID=A0A9P0APH8_BEMTA|nr:unnamed protein product [Bemisia tabaci]
MGATDGQIVAAAARWADEGHYLKEFVAKQRLPAVVKIIKGQYGGIGVPTLPSPGLQSSILLVSLGRRKKIIAQSVKLKEGRRIVPVGPRIVIPETYAGYFEILSEEGKSVRCIESVAELSRRRLEAGCLVREAVRGIVGRYEDDGSVSADGARIVQVGEVLFPEVETNLGNSKARYLRCVDSLGDILLLGLEQRGKFSALAKEDNISGVHTAKNLLNKRLPLTVRLAHGTPPRGLKNANNFVPELRLLSTVEEEHIFALPLQKETGPSLVAEVADRAYVLEGKLGDPKSSRLAPSTPAAKTGYFLRRSASVDSNHLSPGHINNENRTPRLHPEDYDEIDQIYDYVRGFAPLPKNIRSPFPCEPIDDVSSPPASPKDKKPEPPPIETIPSKQCSKAEKRTRTKTASREAPVPMVKLYVKNGNTQRGRLLRQKSNPLKEQVPLAKSGSPIFNIRYKSMSNLQHGMELDGTLDSSHSGGRTSGDSGAGAKLPEKRSRRLSRPRSLTNLVWELPGGEESTAGLTSSIQSENRFLFLVLSFAHRQFSSRQHINQTVNKDTYMDWHLDSFEVHTAKQLAPN